LQSRDRLQVEMVREAVRTGTGDAWQIGEVLRTARRHPLLGDRTTQGRSRV
jgi:hypothetical protein